MFKTLRKGFLAVVLAVVALFTLASCVIGGTQQPTEDPTNKAQAALNEFTANVTFANAEAVTTSFNLPIAGKKGGFDIPISWTSSNEEVIAVVDLMENGAPSTYYKQAKVTRPAFDKEDATVTLTADFSLTYTKNDGTSATLKAQKTYTFVVVKETSEIASGNLAAIKAAAAKFYFEENGVAAGTSSPKELEFPVEFDATVTAVLAAEGTGQFTVSDGSAGIYVYSNKTAVKVGDKVHVKGSITTYYGTLQVGANIEVTVLGDSDQTVEFKPTTPGAINAISTADGMFGGQTVNVAGKLLYGKYNNGSNDSFWLEDVQTGSQIEIYYKSYSADEKTMLQGFVGKYVEMNAVTYDTYSSSAPNDHRIFAIASTIKEATAPELSDADKLAAAVNKVKAVSLAALYVNGQDFAFPVVDGGEGVTITWAMDPATLLVDGKLVVTENGTAKLVATVVVAELSETVELTINVATEAKEEPVVTAKTIAELIALTTEMDAKYTVSGKIVAFGNKLDSNETTAVKYGNLIIADEAGNKIIVYGATATESALTFDAATGKYTYKNAQDFLTNAVTKDIVVGDTVELVVVRTSYNGNPQLNAIVTKVIKGEGGDTPVDPEQPETPVAGVLELTAAKLGLGAYADGSKAVDGVEFSFIELGDYGNGIQMRNKSKASTLWNTTALPGTIKNIVLVYNSAKSTYDNTDALVFTFGNDATLAGGTVKLSTVSGQSTYTVTPDADNYTFFKVAINITYSMYWDSITINYEGGSTTPEAPKHEHVACPTCGKCTAADCDGAAEEKCAGHTTEPEGPVAGSAELPFTATQAAEETAKLADKVASTDKYYVTGTVKSITEISTSYGNGTFVITDGTTDFIIFRAKYLENAKFTSEDQLAVGDTVVVYGQLINYGGTLEMNSGCYLTAHTKAETPETPKHDHVVCPECGKCTAADCDGAAEDKCAGHTTEPETPVASSLELTATKLGLGAYADGTKTVDGVDFGFIELGDFGNGIQMRNKTKPSSLWNATALPKAIKNIVLVYNSAKSTYNNADAFTFLFGTDATVAAGTVKLSTVSGQSTYTVTPDAETYTFFKMTLNLSYSFYWDSITINYVDGTSEPVNPPHEHTEEVLPAKEATCTETGLTEGKKCSTCGEILVAQEEVAAKGHTEEVLAAKDATCTETGLTEGKKCSVCGEVLTAQEEVAAKGHSFAEGKCTVCGADDPDYVAPEQPGTTVEPVAVLETNGNANFWGAYTNTVFLNEGKLITNAQFALRIEITKEADGTLKVTQVVESGVKEFTFAGTYGIVISESHADWKTLSAKGYAVGQYVVIEGDTTTGVATVKFYAENPEQGGEEPEIVPDKADLEVFAKQIVDLFNSTGASDAKVTTREDFKATTHPNIKYVWNKAENLEAYKWLFEFALEEMTAAATTNEYLDNGYYTNIKGLLEKMIAGDTTAVGGDYADGRTILRWWIQGLINARLAPADGVYAKLMVDYSVEENLNRFLVLYAVNKPAAPEQPAEPVTVTLNVKDAATANGWGSSANNLKNAYAIDENVSISVAGGNNSGKFYTDHLRIYATDSPAGSITLTAKEGYKIKSVSFKLVTGTYAFLQLDGATIASEQVVELDASTVTFNTVKNGSDGKQVRVIAVTVTYAAE